MTLENQDFTMWQKEDKRINASIQDGNGDPMQDMSGMSVIWRVCRSLKAAEPVIEKTDQDGITFIDINATNDGVQITLGESDTDSLPGHIYYHECRITDAEGNTEVVFTGKMILKTSKTM